MSMTEPATLDPEVEMLIEDFEFLDGWEDRFRYIIDLGRQLEPMAEDLKNDATKVDGCTSQVWIIGKVTRPDGGARPHLSFVGDSDAHIVRGLIAILLKIYNGRDAVEIVDFDVKSVIARLGFEGQLSPNRANGLYAMVARIRQLAVEALAA